MRGSGRGERVLPPRVRSEESGSHLQGQDWVGGSSPTESRLTTVVSPHTFTQAQSPTALETPRRSTHPVLGTQEVEFKEEGARNSRKPCREGIGRREGRREERGRRAKGTRESG